MTNNRKEENSEAISQTARDEKLSELEILAQSLEAQKQRADEYYDQLLRLKAEFENFRRRADADRQRHISWGKEEVLLKQVSLVDILDQALQSVLTSTNIESIQKGLELIHQEFRKILASEGISEIEAKGKKFDPSIHDAVETVESGEPEGTVLDVLQKGYKLNDRLIRPARVKVAKKAASEAKQS